MQTSNFVFRKASADDDISAIARLIHATDPYIYPCVSGSWTDPAWLETVRESFHTPGDLFWRGHIYLAVHEGNIAGLSCVIPGGAQITFRYTQIAPTETNQAKIRVSTGYFGPLLAENRLISGYNVVNFCVDPAYRGMGLGTAFMRWLVTQLGNQDIRLDVIRDNAPAVRLYENAGFERIAEYRGFCAEGKAPNCLHMLRKGG